MAGAMLVEQRRRLQIRGNRSSSRRFVVTPPNLFAQLYRKNIAFTSTFRDVLYVRLRW